MKKTSTWIALRNPVFKRLWLAMVVSGSCIGAHNTAAYWALNSLGASTQNISLMATVSALPGTLFTLPAGAIADMVDRKKILLTVQLWHASIAVALAILWMAHLLNPYLILASAFLFSAGFAFSSPAHSSVIGRSKLHLWRQRAGIPSHVPGDSAVEAGTYAVKPSTGELLRVVNNGDPLCALHFRN